MHAELLPLEYAHLLNVFYLPMKFQVNESYGFKGMLRTKNGFRQTDQPTDRRTQ